MNRKRIMVGLLSMVLLVMTLSNALVASAAGETPTATVTLVNNASQNAVSLTENSYEYYKIFDVAVTEDGVFHTVNDNFKDYFTGTKQDGAGNDVVFDSTKLGYDHLVSEYLNSYEKAGKMTALVTDLHSYITGPASVPVAYTASKDGWLVTGSDENGDKVESLSTSGVEYGYYLILDAFRDVNGQNNIVAPGMLVNVLNATETVTTKASTPVLDKYIWHDDEGTNGTGEWDVVGDHQTGQTVHYKVSSTVPTNYTGYDDYTYVLTTTKAPGVTYNGDVKVYASDTADSETKGFNEDQLLFDGTYGDGTGFVEEDGYMKKTEGYFTIEYKVDENGNVTDEYKLTVDVIELRKDGVELDEESIYLSYSGVATEDLGTQGDEIDKTTLTYSNDPYKPGSTGSYDKSVYHHVFDITIFKTANNDTTPLADAIFSLSDEAGNKIYLKAETDKVNGVTVYNIVKDGVVTAEAGMITTDDTGKFLIYGLNDAVTYTITEEAAPEGYNKVQPMSFEITATYKDGGKTLDEDTFSVDNEAITAADGSLTTTIVNISKTLLPTTGGMGTTIFVTLGATMMLGALILLIAMKRREREQ